MAAGHVSENAPLLKSIKPRPRRPRVIKYIITNRNIYNRNVIRNFIISYISKVFLSLHVSRAHVIVWVSHQRNQENVSFEHTQENNEFSYFHTRVQIFFLRVHC